MNKQKTGRSSVRDAGPARNVRPSRIPEEDYGRRKPARPAAKARGTSLPFGDDGYARPAYGERPARKARPSDEDLFRARRGYDEELPVRKASRAQSPRPRRDDYEEFDRPARKAPVRSGKKKKKGVNPLLYWAVAVVLALLIGFSVRTFGFELITVHGDAMRGTLVDGEIALVQKSVYYGQKPARGDIVAVNSPDGVLIRRVIALPGETIEIKGGATYVNGEPLDEPYVSEKSGGDYPLTTIPDGGYFVMGDNRLNDDDSRSFGLIKNTRSLIIGKANFIVWPLTGFGSVS